ncbi:MAG: putative transcriptional regulator [Acidimicrobiales bacterium]|nr:putative transcriptional regulator [Acidimicrobiales bacterium]
MSALDSLVDSRRALIVEMKRRGEVTADELATTTGLTVSAVRQHLAGLAADGLVEHRSVRTGPGRPRHAHRLTSQGHALFPAAYGDLTVELLDYFADADPDLVDVAFERRRQRRTAAAKARLSGLDLAGKVAELARVLDEDGYMATSEAMPDGTFRIIEHHCAIFGVARRYGQACSSEIGFIRDVLPEADVERVHHMVSGAHMCAYEVRPRTVHRKKK